MEYSFSSSDVDVDGLVSGMTCMSFGRERDIVAPIYWESNKICPRCCLIMGDFDDMAIVGCRNCDVTFAIHECETIIIECNGCKMWYDHHHMNYHGIECKRIITNMKRRLNH